MKWSEKHIRNLENNGKIVSARIPERNKNFSSNGKPVTIPRETPKGIEWLRWNLMYWCNERAVTLNEQYEFAPNRKFASDFAITAFKILIEYEGGIFMERGGHNSYTGIQRDIEKYQLAQQLGWRVIRVTALTYTTVLKTLNDIVT